MSGSLDALTHGTSGLAFAYGVVLVAMLAGLIRARASLRAILVSPVVAAPLTLVAGMVLALISPLFTAIGLGRDSVLRFVLGIAVAAAISYGVGRWLASRGTSGGPVHRRGAVVSTERAAKETSSAGMITLAGIPVSREDETKHFKLIGTTGTGKSTVIHEMLAAALARGDRAIIADPDGGFLNRFYDADRDVILNPFDGEAHKWDLFAEVTNDYDVEQLARSLIPDSGGPDRTWSEYARTLFTALVQQVINVGSPNDRELFRLLTSAPLSELRLLLACTPAGPFVEEGNEKMFRSIHSVTSSALRVLRHTTRQQAPLLSVRQWVRQGAARHSGGRGGVLFFPYRAGEIAALGSVISAWMRLGIFEAMDRAEATDQRLWFVVDELDALGEIDGLKDALARLRKFGGRCVLGFQSISQVSGTYGRGAADTIVENCGNTLILRCSASERGGTSEFASKLIGQREVVHTTHSKTRKPTDWMSSTTSSEHLRVESAVMASEIERLPDLEGYLKLASTPDWLAVKLTPLAEPGRPRPRRPVNVVLPAESRASVPSSANPAAADVATSKRKARASSSAAASKGKPQRKQKETAPVANSALDGNQSAAHAPPPDNAAAAPDGGTGGDGQQDGAVQEPTGGAQSQGEDRRS